VPSRQIPVLGTDRRRFVLSTEPEPPFLVRLREIADGKRPMPNAETTKRHHYVPSFLLARWAKPKKRDGELYELEAATGQVRATHPDKVSWKRDLYTVEETVNSSLMIVESFLGVVESHASDPIKNLASLPNEISDEDRGTIAFFMALQQMRTPAGLAQNEKLAELAALQAIASQLQDRDVIAARYRSLINPAASDEEADNFARNALRSFKDGAVTVELPPEARLQAMLRLVSPNALTIVTMNWTLLRATSGEFVASDRGLAMWDPALPERRGSAWESSAQAETTIPVAPDTCLRITPGSEGFAVATVEQGVVDEVNLRTYGWAEKSIFGTSPQSVQAVYNAAQANPKEVPTPKVPPLPPLPGS
jgi:hypothetical protein